MTPVPGADAFRGFAGNDSYGVDNSADVVLKDAGGGNDTIFTTAGSLVQTLSARELTSTSTLKLYGNNEATPWSATTSSTS